MSAAAPLDALERVLGARPSGVRPVSGGDICDAWSVETADGRCFAKSLADAPPG